MLNFVSEKYWVSAVLVIGLWTALVFGCDVLHINSSSKWEQLQYPLNGSSCIDFAMFSVKTSGAGGAGGSGDASGTG